MGNDSTLKHGDSRAFTERVEIERFGPKTQAIFDHLTSRVIGQERAAEHVARRFSIYYSGLGDGRRPIGSFIFSGPTGVGKTLMAEELARCLVADQPHAPLIRIQCGKYKESHRVSELIGSPPGYVQSDKPGMLSQMKIDEPHFWVKARPFLEKRFRDRDPKKLEDVLANFYQEYRPYLSVILFDEVEKAHNDLWNLLLHIIDDGELTMANGEITDFRNSVVILTCNVGGRRQQELLAGKSHQMGFGTPESDISQNADLLDQRIYGDTVKLIEERFAPELVGRLRSEIIIFRTLDYSSRLKVLELMLSLEQEKVSGRRGTTAPPMLLHFSEEFKAFLLQEGSNRLYGLRPLRDVVHKRVTLPLSTSIECGALEHGDEVLFTMEGSEPAIYRKPHPEPREAGRANVYQRPAQAVHSAGSPDDEEQE
ncbi:hypothetical protein AMJ57_00730 [Parcubacteria bacterium SG8_24]|nr:MAG: hypothetical protein AMJ57_00730 [Parcubacteria bacterium SG8_24]